jgi:DNA (cytosine-5)-methyltransferase 1
MAEKMELKRKRSTKHPPAEVVDLFCGVGALSHGLKMAGLQIVAGYDIDARCKHAFEKNNGGEFFTRTYLKIA